MLGGRTIERGRLLMLLPKGLPQKYLIAVHAIRAPMFEPGAELPHIAVEADKQAELETRLEGLEKSLLETDQKLGKYPARSLEHPERATNKMVRLCPGPCRSASMARAFPRPPKA